MLLNLCLRFSDFIFYLRDLRLRIKFYLRAHLSLILVYSGYGVVSVA